MWEIDNVMYLYQLVFLMCWYLFVLTFWLKVIQLLVQGFKNLIKR